MVGNLLLRGMLIGILAGPLCFAFLKIVGEPPVDRAIAFETKMDAAKDKAAADAAKAKNMPMPTAETYEEIVSRSTQAGLGLFTGVLVYAVAFGGLFALAFVHGRMGPYDPRATAALVAVMGFVAVYVAPNLKYPANPPSIGNSDTIGIRTGLYFSMILVSLIAMVAATKLRGSILDRFGGWNATIVAGAFYLLAMLVAGLLPPGIDEVPEAFPAVVLWQFRIASFGAQLIMWTTIGLGFGVAADRLMQAETPRLGAAIRT